MRHRARACLDTSTDACSRVLSLTATLFTILHNPLNLTLLTSQVLTAPAIWSDEDGLKSCVRCLGVFQQAAGIIVRQEREIQEHKRSGQGLPFTSFPINTSIRRDEWIKAVFRGADERSPTWTHTLVLAGLLMGFERTQAGHLSRKSTRYLTQSLIDTVNRSLHDLSPGDELGRACISMVLTYTNDFVSHPDAARLDHDRLLPTLVKSAFMSNEGYRSGYVLGGIDPDIIQQPGDKFTWSPRSPSFHKIADVTSKPLHSAMGSLAKVMATTIENVSDTNLVQGAVQDLVDFSQTLHTQWRQTKLSEVDVSEEKLYFDEQALTVTLPALWKMLRHAVFGVVLLLRSALARTLSDSPLGQEAIATRLSASALKVLRNLYFVSNRLGVNSFQQHVFAYLTAIDIICHHPPTAVAFINSIRPSTLGKIPRHPLDRNLDLYFLNTAECFAAVLPPHMNDELLVAAASPYLTEGGNKNLLEIFESAHSVMLAVLSSPQSAELASKYAPFYVNSLFRVFPSNISSRQFRLAYRTLLEICSPPSPLATTHPQMTETLMELLRHRALVHPDLTRPTPFAAIDSRESNQQQRTSSTPPQAAERDEERLDERTALTLTLIDCLPVLPVSVLETWLSLAAELIPRLDTDESKEKVRSRFWEVIAGGEMDVERSRVCVVWWSTKGGREVVLLEGETEGDKYMMSGALGSRFSKL